MADAPDPPTPASPPLPASRVSVLAIVAFIFCLVPCTFPIGGVLVGATFLQIRRRPDLWGFGLAKIGLGVGLGLMLLALFAFPKLLEHADRIRCRQNLMQLAKAIQAYAEQNYGAYPNVGLGYDPGRGKNHGESLDTMASMWLLVTTGVTAGNSFICPSDEGSVPFKLMALKTEPFPDCNDEGLPVQRPWGDVSIKDARRCWSYGYQIPRGGHGRNWAKYAIMADRSPPLTGKVEERMILLTDLGGETPTDSNTASQIIRKASAKDRMRINSPNHGGDGQNVLYQDGHVDWCNTPCCGIYDDNIYTVAIGPVTTLPDGRPDLTPRVVGSIPTENTVPYDQEDSVIVNISWGTLTEVYTK